MISRVSFLIFQKDKSINKLDFGKPYVIHEMTKEKNAFAGIVMQ